MNTIWCIEIGGIEVFGVEKKNYKGDIQAWNNDLLFSF